MLKRFSLLLIGPLFGLLACASPTTVPRGDEMGSIPNVIFSDDGNASPAGQPGEAPATPPIASAPDPDPGLSEAIADPAQEGRTRGLELVVETPLLEEAPSDEFAEVVMPEPVIVAPAPTTAEPSRGNTAPRSVTGGLTGGNVSPGAEPPLVDAFPDGLPEDADFVEVPIYLATNRRLADDPDQDEPASQFNDVNGPVQYARAVVTIPREHRMGVLESQNVVAAFFFEPDPEKHVILKSIDLSDREDVLSSVTAELATTENAVLMYVHGYNTDLEKATRRAGQLTYDLGWDGPSFLFSWPSRGRASAYFIDSTMAARSTTAMTQVLGDLAGLDADRIIVIAHSMGTRVLSNGLADLVRDEPDLAAKITTVILAAPDIDEEVFHNQLAPRFRELEGSQFTLYASSEDVALKASETANGFIRIGDTSNGVPVVEGFDVIDASTTVSDFFSHTYFGDDATILSDIHAMINEGLPVDARPTLEEVIDGENRHWRIRASR